MLVDTPPDLRTQCLAHGVAHVDAVLYTHEHADHVNGIDDMRRFSALQDGYITCYANSRTAGELHVRFPYCFPDAEARAGEWVRWSLPTLRTETLNGPFNLFGLRVTPMSVMHNQLRIGSMMRMVIALFMQLIAIIFLMKRGRRFLARTS